jgi:hypothetical protein
MNKLEILTHVASDGTLTVPVPDTFASANAPVRVTVEPVGLPDRPALGQDEWRRFIAATAGSIADPAFRRYDQGTPEQRESL